MLVWRAPVDTVSHGSESTVENGINFIFCLGTTYDISSMESVGSSKSFSLVGKVCISKCFYLSIFALSSGTSTNPYLCNFYFMQFFIYLSLHLLL